jgi:anti-sigma B factor antagonist
VGLYQFEIVHEAEGARHTLALEGELDIAAAPRLEKTLRDLCDDGASEIVVDLEGLEFIDSTGLHALIGGMRHCRACGCAFLLTRAGKQTMRLFELTGTLELLPLVELPPPPSPAATERPRDGRPRGGGPR